jgi:RHS repeat-associated protein
VDAIHTDQTGRPQVVTDSNQAVVWKATNYPFEREVAQDDIGGLNLGFPGQYYDVERGLWNNGFRDYNASLGRYVESDPSGLNGGVNTYTYVENNPINGVDPLGLCDQQKCTAARALVASLGQQLSSAGKTLTWTGIAVVAVSGVAAIPAP